MKHVLSATLIALMSLPTLANDVDPWEPSKSKYSTGVTMVGEGVFVYSVMAERFGPTVLVPFGGRAGDYMGGYFQWHWAHCERLWITDVAAMLSTEFSKSLPAQYAEAVGKRDRLVKYPVAFAAIAATDVGEHPKLDRAIADLCKTAKPSQSDAEVPIASSELTKNGEGFVDYLILKTIVKRAGLTEAWLNRRPIKAKPATKPDGSPRLLRDGTPALDNYFTEQQSEAKLKVHVKCAERSLTISKFVKYTADGTGIPSPTDTGKLTFDEPIPGSIGESYVDAFCRI